MEEKVTMDRIVQALLEITFEATENFADEDVKACLDNLYSAYRVALLAEEYKYVTGQREEIDD